MRQVDLSLNSSSATFILGFFFFLTFFWVCIFMKWGEIISKAESEKELKSFLMRVKE